DFEGRGDAATTEGASYAGKGPVQPGHHADPIAVRLGEEKGAEVFLREVRFPALEWLRLQRFRLDHRDVSVQLGVEVVDTATVLARDEEAHLTAALPARWSRAAIHHLQLPDGVTTGAGQRHQVQIGGAPPPVDDVVVQPIDGRTVDLPERAHAEVTAIWSDH